MKFTISTKEFQSKLTAVSKVIQNKNILKVLDFAMVSQVDNRFYLTGASTENQVTVGLDLLQTSKGDFKPFCVDVAQFVAMLATLPEQPIEIEVDENVGYHTVVRYAGGDFKLSSLPADEFPIRPRLDDTTTQVAFEIPSAILIPATKAARFCAGNDELYPQLMGVALDVSVDGVTFVSTDRHRFYRYIYSHGVPFLTGEPATIIFPRMLVSALEAVVGKSEIVSVRANKKAIEVVVDDAVLIATTINGSFPDYSRVIPSESNYHAKVSVGNLSLAIKRASIMADSSIDLLILSKDADALSICSMNEAYGKSSTTRVESADCNVPDGFRIGLKASGLLTLLGNISTDDVYLHLSNPSRPVVLKEDSDNSTLVELIMPMNIGGV